MSRYSRRHRRPTLIACFFAAMSAPWMTSPARAELQLGFPVACEFGVTCFIQNYVDIDAGPNARDFTCGTATYDGHTGTDIRVLSDAAAKPGVDVVAAAGGVVRGVRDGVADRRILSGADRAAVAGRECGNGLVVDHGGSETQYCHMQRGSILVKAGDTITRGQRLGRIGASGLAEFSHLHFEVRVGGKPVDPFLGAGAGTACRSDGLADGGMWSADVAAMLGPPATTVLEVGFATGKVDTAMLEAGGTAIDAPTADASALVFFSRFANLRSGDVLRLRLAGPADFVAASEIPPLERSKATYVAFVGKKRPAGQSRWPTGVYRGTVELVRGGAVILSRSGELEVP